MFTVTVDDYNTAYADIIESILQKLTLLITGKAQEEKAFGKSNHLTTLVDYMGAALYSQLLYAEAFQYASTYQLIRGAPPYSLFLDLNPDLESLKACAACKGLNLASILKASGIEELFDIES